MERKTQSRQLFYFYKYRRGVSLGVNHLRALMSQAADGHDKLPVAPLSLRLCHRWPASTPDCTAVC